MHIGPCSWAIEICKSIRIRNCFGLVKVHIVEIFLYFAFWRHGIKLAIFLIAHDDDCCYSSYYKKWFSTLDRSNLLF